MNQEQKYKNNISTLSRTVKFVSIPILRSWKLFITQSFTKNLFSINFYIFKIHLRQTVIDLEWFLSRFQCSLAVGRIEQHYGRLRRTPRDWNWSYRLSTIRNRMYRISKFRVPRVVVQLYLMPTIQSHRQYRSKLSMSRFTNPFIIRSKRV